VLQNLPSFSWNTGSVGTWGVAVSTFHSVDGVLSRKKANVLRKRLRSSNLLERSLEEVQRRVKVIGRFPGETSCLSLCWAVLDLFISGARGLGLTDLDRRQLDRLRAERQSSQLRSPAGERVTCIPPETTPLAFPAPQDAIHAGPSLGARTGC